MDHQLAATRTLENHEVRQRGRSWTAVADRLFADTVRTRSIAALLLGKEIWHHRKQSRRRYRLAACQPCRHFHLGRYLVHRNAKAPYPTSCVRGPLMQTRKM
jgi:hypothetical protein